jgi:hypothetical protein
MSRTVLVRSVALVGVILLLGVALCLLDGDDGAGCDLCLVSLALGSTLALLPLPVVGRLEFTRLPTRPLLLVDLALPPPKR